jgi:predicted ATPase
MGPGTLLKSITIQDLAVVRHLDLEFQAGLTVVTGETGACKSIVQKSDQQRWAFAGVLQRNPYHLADAA